MTNKEIEFIKLTNEQYEELVEIQIEAYKQIVNFCKENINDNEKIIMIDERISEIDKRILTKLEEIKIYNNIFIETIK